MRTLVQVARSRAVSDPDRVAINFLVDGSNDSIVRLTYSELDRRARATAAILQGLADPGDRAILLFPPGIEYIVALFGCLYAGVVAVPAYPLDRKSMRPAARESGTRFGRNTTNRTLPRLEAILRDSSPRLALAPALDTGEVPHGVWPEEWSPDLEWVATDKVADGAEHGFVEPQSSDDLALLQYTSGSTQAPRGVMLKHANLMHNLGMIQDGFGLSAADRIGSWLPPYHDMGLIGSIFISIYLGAELFLMSPVSFLLRPISWLDAISRHKLTGTGGPNFAFDLCVRKVPPERRVGLDLSSLNIAFVGSEPIRSSTLQAFTETYRPFGFDPKAYFPCYGLAEATLFVSGSTRFSGYVQRSFKKEAYDRKRVVVTSDASEPHIDLVGSGRVHRGADVLIVDPETRMPCDDGQVGEVWVCGPNVASGYWNRPDDPTFGSELASGSNGRKFLRTGDLGFFHEGELFVCGRIKELIIVRGRNLYPQDIEATVGACHPRIRSDSCAAFSVLLHDGEAERVVVVAEVSSSLLTAEQLEAIREAVKSEVSAAHDIRVDRVVFIAAGTMFKTSSGKIQRNLCRTALLAGSLPEFKGAVPVDPGSDENVEQRKTGGAR